MKNIVAAGKINGKDAEENRNDARVSKTVAEKKMNTISRTDSKYRVPRSVARRACWP